MGRKKHIEESHSEGWLVSYCDMISLLVTFFLMMMTFSTKYAGDVTEIGVGLLKGRGGVWPALQGTSYTQDVDADTLGNLARDLGDLESSAEGAESKGEVGFRSSSDGVSVHFDVESSFAPGSSEPTPALVHNLGKLAHVLGRYNLRLVVEGYDDGSFEPSVQFPTVDALTTERATRAAGVLRQESALARRSLEVASLGAQRPRADNATAVGRAWNRRVEVRILPPANAPQVTSVQGAPQTSAEAR